MSQISKALLGAFAITVALGAAQLASGHDLADRWQAVAAKPSHDINRAGKSDRIAEPRPSSVPTRTVSTRLNDLKDTSVLLRVPAVIETGNAAKPPTTLLQKNRRTTIACEPVVSSLTEVAKLLQPGRCVT